MNKVLITGITGQDESYLAELLLNKDQSFCVRFKFIDFDN